MYDQLIVVKVGTNVMKNKNNRIVRPVLQNLVSQIATLYERNIMTILVSSGSAIAGKEVIGPSKIKDKSVRRQVYSSIGQPRMMRLYYNIFHDYGINCAQVLPTKRDFQPGVHRDNMVNCYKGLLEEGVIPVANEDDTVSLTSTMFTDNDEMASLIAELVEADKLIILTDIDGVFTGNPDDEKSELIEEVTSIENLDKYIQENTKGEGEGRGGMKSKINVAQKSAKNNIPTYIANGKTENIIIDIIDDEYVGTRISNDNE
ncbi:glutamate 5-kinase [Wenyingzhuangia aestuarii]|uniref:glutamate 5-kinase n=1 Tax=Wenyingzhuangia aestuarii TaxID=1647582 RepID=UPI0014398D43|nr:glutamate 5-kinase [Wenyingzhuangia aestuarii]NJB81874.1 glutamate 5-kinase [Wenyingzhuangia aestuarii]